MKLNNKIKSIAIGSFDGIHIAHKTLIDQVDALVIIERNGGYLTPGYKRSFFTSKVCCFYHFDKIKSLTPEEFVFKIKEDFPMLEKILVGFDFTFGKQKSGNADMLSELFDREVLILDEVSIENIPIHSRQIKAYLKEGNIEMTNKLLGRRYSIEGDVISGQGLGKKELMPTVNLHIYEYQLPLEGVYATRTKIENKWYLSVSFLGHRVSTDGNFAIETHVIDKDILEVNGKVMIEFIEFIRKNKKFDGLESLKAEIQNDISKAKDMSK